jgi:transposase
MERHISPSDGRDDEWSVVALSLTVMTEEAPQREHSLRDVLNGWRWMGRTGAQWRMMPHDLPPWAAVSQHTQRWLKAGVFEAIVNDVRALLRVVQGRNTYPSATIVDSRTLHSSPESGHRAGSDGAKRRRGSNVHAAVDTLGNLPALVVTPADEQDRAHVGTLAVAVQEVTHFHIEVAFVDQGDTDEKPAQAANAQGRHVQVVTLPEATRGVVVLPRRWVVERRFAWTTRFRRLARDDERWPETLAGLHVLAFPVLMLHRFPLVMAHSS